MSDARWDSSKRVDFERALDEAVKTLDKTKIELMAKLATKAHKHYKELVSLLEKYCRKQKRSSSKLGVVYAIDAILRAGDARLTPERNPYPKRIEKSLVMGTLYSTITEDLEERHTVKLHKMLKLWTEKREWFEPATIQWMNGILSPPPPPPVQQAIFDAPIAEQPRVRRYGDDESPVRSDTRYELATEPVPLIPEQDPTFAFDYGDDSDEEDNDDESEDDIDLATTGDDDDSVLLGVVIDNSNTASGKKYALSTTVVIDNSDQQLELSAVKDAFSQSGAGVSFTESDQGKVITIRFARRSDAEDALNEIMEVDGRMLISHWGDPGVGTGFDKATGKMEITDEEARVIPAEKVQGVLSSPPLTGFHPRAEPFMDFSSKRTRFI